jgi:hypothetical protein
MEIPADSRARASPQPERRPDAALAPSANWFRQRPCVADGAECARNLRWTNDSSIILR